MKLIRFGAPGQEKPGIVDAAGKRRDLSAHFKDWTRDFWREDGLARLQTVLQEHDSSLPEIPENERWGAGISRPGKIVCIGLNYYDHAEESGMEVPPEPVVFMKAANTMVGPYDDILIPRGSEKTDWEVELGIVIGRDARYLDSPEDSANYIAGYCISHDVSERAFQLEHAGQWTKGKSCDTFNPVGPYLATPDEIGDVRNLPMILDVNGERMQSGNTNKMAYNEAYLVYYLSQFMTLEAGDLISTGTPPGVGQGKKPPRFLKAGDVVEMGIEGLGNVRNTCRNA